MSVLFAILFKNMRSSRRTLLNVELSFSESSMLLKRTFLSRRTIDLAKLSIEYGPKLGFIWVGVLHPHIISVPSSRDSYTKSRVRLLLDDSHEHIVKEERKSQSGKYVLVDLVFKNSSRLKLRGVAICISNSLWAAVDKRLYVGTCKGLNPGPYRVPRALYTHKVSRSPLEFSLEIAARKTIGLTLPRNEAMKLEMVCGDLRKCLEDSLEKIIKGEYSKYRLEIAKARIDRKRLDGSGIAIDVDQDLWWRAVERIGDPIATKALAYVLSVIT